VQYKIKV